MKRIRVGVGVAVRVGILAFGFRDSDGHDTVDNPFARLSLIFGNRKCCCMERGN